MVARKNINAGISLPKRTIEFLDVAASVMRTPKSELIRMAIERWRPDLEKSILESLNNIDILHDLPIQLCVPATKWSQLVTPTLASGVLTVDNPEPRRISALKYAVGAFLERWPTAASFMQWHDATPDNGRLAVFANEIGIIGIGSLSRRTSALIGIAETIVGWPAGMKMARDDVAAIPYVGQYAADSFAIFYLNDYTTEPTDTRLLAYVLDKRMG